MAYGGRVAEEMIFGHDRVTTGAASDIQKATSIARRYVTQWGLSDAIGPILVGDNEQELFLGREMQHRREVSEQTAQLVDAEVKRVIERERTSARARCSPSTRTCCSGGGGAARARDAERRGDRGARAGRDAPAAPTCAEPRPRSRRRRRSRGRGEAGQAADAWRSGGRTGVTVAGERAAWLVRGRALRLDRPLVLGISNVTPDSFSDGGRFFPRGCDGARRADASRRART